MKIHSKCKCGDEFSVTSDVFEEIELAMELQEKWEKRHSFCRGEPMLAPESADDCPVCESLGETCDACRAKADEDIQDFIAICPLCQDKIYAQQDIFWSEMGQCHYHRSCHLEKLGEAESEMIEDKENEENKKT